MHHEAMADSDVLLWLAAMKVEIEQLESMDCWDVIPRSEWDGKVIPSLPGRFDANEPLTDDSRSTKPASASEAISKSKESTCSRPIPQ